MKLTQQLQVLLSATAKILVIGCGLLAISAVHAANIRVNVVDANGNRVSGFRFLLQQDTTYALDPANPAAVDQQLALNFHKSYHPPARYTGNGNNTDVIVGSPNVQVPHLDGEGVQGNADGSSVVIRNIRGTNAAPRRYYVSVFPYSGYAMGGAPVTVTSNPNAPVDVVVEQYPLPTTQISVYLFHDCFPLNGAPDLPEELATSDACPWAAPDFTQFSVIVEEPAGKRR